MKEDNECMYLRKLNLISLCKKKKKKEKPRLVATDDNWCLLGHSAFRLDLSHRLYPDPFSNASNEYVARCARS